MQAELVTEKGKENDTEVRCGLGLLGAGGYSILLLGTNRTFLACRSCGTAPKLNRFALTLQLRMGARGGFLQRFLGLRLGYFSPVVLRDLLHTGLATCSSFFCRMLSSLF